MRSSPTPLTRFPTPLLALPDGTILSTYSPVRKSTISDALRCWEEGRGREMRGRGLKVGFERMARGIVRDMEGREGRSIRFFGDGREVGSLGGRVGLKKSASEAQLAELG